MADRIPVHIDEAQYRQIRSYCVQKGVTKASFVRELIGRFFRDLHTRQNRESKVVQMPERRTM